MRWFLGKHDIQVRRLEDLLAAVKRQAAELALDEIRPVLHDGLELDMPVRTLPSWNQMKHVLTLVGLSIFYAFLARELDVQANEKWHVCDTVAHPHQAGVKVDFACKGGYSDKARISYTINQFYHYNYYA